MHAFPHRDSHSQRAARGDTGRRGAAQSGPSPRIEHLENIVKSGLGLKRARKDCVRKDRRGGSSTRPRRHARVNGQSRISRHGGKIDTDRDFTAAVAGLVREERRPDEVIN
jgi:hypothetical protein